MNEQIVAIIPVREGSNRIKRKNYIEFFGGKSLLDIKIEQLKKSSTLNRIYVSSDNEYTKNISKEKKVDFLLRDSRACSETMRWSDVVCNIVNTVPGNPIIVWALATSPLFSDFDSAIKAYLANENQNDSLVAVHKKKSFLLNESGKCINYNPGVWHPYSQELEPLYEVTGACFIARKSDMLKWKYWFGVKPFLFEVSNELAVDVDTLDDFTFAQKIYKTLEDE